MAPPPKACSARADAHAEGHDSMQDVIAVYQRDIDMTLVRQRLAMSVEERFEAHQRALRLVEELRCAGERARADAPAGAPRQP